MQSLKIKVYSLRKALFKIKVHILRNALFI